jgi:hypothetical protein
MSKQGSVNELHAKLSETMTQHEAHGGARHTVRAIVLGCHGKSQRVGTWEAVLVPHEPAIQPHIPTNNSQLPAHTRRAPR